MEGTVLCAEVTFTEVREAKKELASEPLESRLGVRVNCAI